jgi:hypothetical protein
VRRASLSDDGGEVAIPLAREAGPERSYWENTQASIHAAGKPRPEVKLPVGFTTFPGEIWRTPRSWVEKSYPNVTYFNEVDRGGHFAAWEEPDLFASEIRASNCSVSRDRPGSISGDLTVTSTNWSPAKPKFPPSRLVNVLYQVVEPLIMKIT